MITLSQSLNIFIQCRCITTLSCSGVSTTSASIHLRSHLGDRHHPEPHALAHLAQPRLGEPADAGVLGQAGLPFRAGVQRRPYLCKLIGRAHRPRVAIGHGYASSSSALVGYRSPSLMMSLLLMPLMFWSRPTSRKISLRRAAGCSGVIAVPPSSSSPG